ncbi:hypothetical protein ABLB96_11400 [Acinetobacter sp. XH1741]|uniref:amino acid kinase family protein n=1 Tax=Acinetobacter TaxID=469 RepID=UPI0032B40ED3
MNKKNISGYLDLNIDLVIKFGGSLLKDPEEAGALLEIINEASQNGARLLVVPGGGPPDKSIEEIYAKRKFTMPTAHEACALAQDQIGLILSDPYYSKASLTCRNFKDIRIALDNLKTPILLPSQLIMSLDPVEYSWDITSDAIAGWIAWQVGAPKLIVLTDVDGIYDLDICGNLLKQKPIESASAADIVKIGHTSIDVCLAKWIAHGFINECLIINGKYSERLQDTLLNKNTLSTRVYYSNN